MKHYNQVSIEAQNKLASLRQEARIQEQVASKPLSKRIGITSAISISIILVIAFSIITIGQPGTDLAMGVPELQLSTAQEAFLPMAQTLNPQLRVADTLDMTQFMAHTALTMEILTAQSLALEIEHLQTVVASMHFVADSVMPQTDLYFMTAIEKHLLAL